MTYIDTLAIQFGLSDNSMREIRMIHQEDLRRIEQQKALAEIEAVNEIIDSGAKTFITGPIKAWDETRPLLREVELVSFHNGHATVIVQNAFLTIMKEDLLIEVLSRDHAK